MTEPLNGLRFDIYERVNLPDELAPIEELEEIELIPSMRALSQDDHILLKGHLLLSGVYRAPDQEQGTSRLEHAIPVEISLPPSRVARLEDLSIEIDNFDVDLLSARSLNVTGVLALRGLQAESHPVPVWHENSFTVVHQAPSEADPGRETREEQKQEDRWRSDEGWGDISGSSPFPGLGQPEEERETEAVPLAGERTASHEPEEADFAVQRDFDAFFEPFRSDANSDARENDEQDEHFGLSEAESQDQERAQISPIPSAQDSRLDETSSSPVRMTDEFHPPAADPRPEERQAAFEENIPGGVPESGFRPAEKPSVRDTPEPIGSFADAYAEEKPEMIVALGRNPSEAAERVHEGVGLLSKLGEKGEAREAALRANRADSSDQEEEARERNRSTTGDELEWTKLFLGNGEESQAFRKLRMCIVQRDDTLDSIAARYNVPVRELQLKNRLNDLHLMEGQVLIIP